MQIKTVEFTIGHSSRAHIQMYPLDNGRGFALKGTLWGDEEADEQYHWVDQWATKLQQRLIRITNGTMSSTEFNNVMAIAQMLRP